jgi:hypothetical protein
MSETQPVARVWYKARLTPVAQNVFTEGFYPERNRLGHQYVYFTQVNVTPTTPKIIVASRAKENSIRMLTLDLARLMLQPVSKLPTKQCEQLDLAAQHVKL